MNHDQVITHGTGQRGRDIWNRIKRGDVGHNEILAEMRSTQEMLAAYAKHATMDKVQEQMIGEIKLLETFAWRTYMFGKPHQFSMLPGQGGELAKRLRNDLKYHAERDREMTRFGEWGCQYENNMFSPIKRKCLNPQCKHKAVHYKQKALKLRMRQEWERDILSRYKY